jgi:hypothetical protein
MENPQSAFQTSYSRMKICRLVAIIELKTWWKGNEAEINHVKDSIHLLFSGAKLMLMLECSRGPSCD